MITILDIAEALARELNAGSYSMAFEAAVSLRPSFTREELKDLHVTVVPKSVLVDDLARDTRQYDFAVDIGIQQAVDPEGLDDLRGLIVLAGEIVTQFQGHPLRDCPDAAVMKAANEPVYVPDHLATLRQFTSVITLTFRLLVEAE